MKKVVLLFCLFFMLTLMSTAQDEDATLTLLTHDSFNVSEDVLNTFQEETGITVEILRGGDTGQMLNQAILTKDNLPADIMFGVDNTFLGRALDEELFIPYMTPLLESIDGQFIIDESFSVTPITYGDVCLNYDVAYFEEENLPLPESLTDLTDPAYNELLVVQNPASSSPGLAFLLATVAEFGTPDDDDNEYTYLDFWRDLMDNGTRVVDGWSTAYYGEFTAASEDGFYPMVVSYASSPPFTVNEEGTAASTRSIVADNMCFRQVEFAGILRGTERESEAQQFIDFMLGEAFQSDVPDQMYVFPVATDTELPELFAEFAALPDNPATLTPQAINAGRDTWIEAWLELIRQ
ncbi:MAG: thiamine ABC transporter substrate-binding protein [Aggregatilineales bacterium]